MGNSTSSSRAHQDDSVDYGFLSPQGVYTGTPDWNQQIVAQLIVERRLAPFYRPLEDYDENWDDEQILAARKQLPGDDVATSESVSRVDGAGGMHSSASRSNSVHSSLHSSKRPGALKEPSRTPEAMVYRGAVECPICFLYYPPNINHSRCCDQAICTECFVQIKRSEPTTTHVVSEPAACPYCVQENFGVTYTPPAWRAGIGADGSHSPIHASPSQASPQQSVEIGRSRRKSFGADSAEVVTIDQIRPDWEAKLAAVRAAVARRANRRIIMRQVGDRLIPVGVSSGRIHPLAGGAAVTANGEQGPENPNENEGRVGRRSRRRQHQQQPQDFNQFLGTMGLGGQDLEELMVMEAMRLSLLEHEEQQRKEAEEKKKEEEERIAKDGKPSESANGENEAGSSSSASGLELPPIPTTSPIDVTQSPSRSLLPVDSSSPNRHSPSFSAKSSPASSASTEPGSSLRQPGPSLLGAPATSSIGISIAHSGSRTHSRSGSATPSIRTSTPRENADRPSVGMLSSAVLVAHGEASAVLATSGGETSESSPANVSDSSTSTIAAPHFPDYQTGLTPLMVPEEEEATTSTTDTAVSIPGGTNRSLSSLFVAIAEGESYDELPSSPDSPSQRPLLLDTPVSEIPGLASDSESIFGPTPGARTAVAE